MVDIKFVSGEFTTGEVALMLFYAVQISSYFSWVVRQSAELQNAVGRSSKLNRL